MSPVSWSGANTSHSRAQYIFVECTNKYWNNCKKKKKKKRKKKKKKRKKRKREFRCGAAEIINHEVTGSIPGLAQWIKDPTLLWLWHRPVATAPIWTPAWELPYAKGVGLKSKKRKEERQKQEPNTVGQHPCSPKFFFCLFCCCYFLGCSRGIWRFPG